jgi:hypothetical protein
VRDAAGTGCSGTGTSIRRVARVVTFLEVTEFFTQENAEDVAPRYARFSGAHRPAPHR